MSPKWRGFSLRFSAFLGWCHTEKHDQPWRRSRPPMRQCWLKLSSLSSTGHTLKNASELAGESHPKNCLHAIHRKKHFTLLVLHTFSSTFSSLNKNTGSFLDPQLNPPKKTKRENVVLFFPPGSRGRQDGVGGYLRSSEWRKNIPTNLDNLATNHANHLPIGSM